MKIGILTYHRSYNYGALLQAIALRQLLSRLGHDVTFIDYWPNHNKDRYSLFSFRWMMKTQSGFNKKIKYVLSCLTNYMHRKRRNKSFLVFIKDYIQPNLSSMTDPYDIVIYGSDQIWRKQPEINTYNPVYFGVNGIRSGLKMSYAASMGKLPDSKSDEALIKNYVSYLDVITVRENNLKVYLCNLGFKNVKLVLDPTLLLTSDEWVNLLHIPKCDGHYVLYYKLQNAFVDSEILEFAKEKGLSVKVITGRYKNKIVKQEENYVGPVRFLELIANSSFVFTSSFHGLAFALLFHKPFFASFVNNSSRAMSLLSLLNLSDRFIAPYAIIPKLEMKQIDFTIVDEKINSIRNESKQFLSDTINSFFYKK